MTDASVPAAAGESVELRVRRLVARAVAAGNDRDSVLRAVCSTATDELDMRSAVVQLSTGGQLLGIACGSDEASLRVADLAFTVGEGPSLDAFEYRRPVLVADLQQASGRWPGFTQAAVEQGIRGVFSFPLQIGGAILGILDLYADRVRALTDDEQRFVASLAELAGQVVLGELPVDRTWGPLLDHRAEVHQAQGMVMVDLGIDLAEALVRMRAFAFAAGIDLMDLATNIISGFALPAAEGEPG